MGMIALQSLIVIAFGCASLYFINPHTVLGKCLAYGLTVSLLQGVLWLLSWHARRRQRRRREPRLYPDIGAGKDPRRGLQGRLTARRGSEEGLELWDGVWVGEQLGQVIDASAEPESFIGVRDESQGPWERESSCGHFPG